MMLVLFTSLIFIGSSSGEKTVEILSSTAINRDTTPVTSSLISENKLQGNSKNSDSHHNKLENWNKISDGNHHKITKRNSLSHDNEIGFYSKLIKDLQELIDREQDFFPDEKRYFGRYLSSNHLIKSLNGMKWADRDSQIAKHFGLLRPRRSADKSTGDSSQQGDGNVGDDNYIMNTVRDMLNQKSDHNKNIDSDESSVDSNLLGKRFFGRVRNSNYILSKQRLGDDIKELLKNHWKTNWTKRIADIAGKTKQSNLSDELSLPKKRFQVDLDYSFLWSLMMNKDKEAAERALKMYMNP